MDLFGFEEDLDLQNTNVVRKDTAPAAVSRKSPTRDRNDSLSISQIQDILRHELEAQQKLTESVTASVDESITNDCIEQSVLESTLYEEPSGINEVIIPYFTESASSYSLLKTPLTGETYK